MSDSAGSPRRSNIYHRRNSIRACRCEPSIVVDMSAWSLQTLCPFSSYPLEPGWKKLQETNEASNTCILFNCQFLIIVITFHSLYNPIMHLSNDWPNADFLVLHWAVFTGPPTSVYAASKKDKGGASVTFRIGILNIPFISLPFPRNNLHQARLVINSLSEVTPPPPHTGNEWILRFDVLACHLAALHQNASHTHPSASSSLSSRHPRCHGHRLSHVLISCFNTCYAPPPPVILWASWWYEWVNFTVGSKDAPLNELRH